LLFKRLAGLTCVGLLAGCVVGLSAAGASAATLAGAGSTLVAPIEAEWAAAFDSATGNTITYNAVGSGTGEKDIAQGLVDFGASDAPLSAYTGVPSNLVQIPWALSATGVSYHLSGVSKLKLTGNVIAAIYVGQVKFWDDPKIKNLNKRLHLPHTPITVFHRSDGSGDTFAFTKYESTVSPTFRSKIGASTTVSWPVGPGAKGNTGLATAVAQTNGAIAYIAVSYLIADRLPAVFIQNAAGRYIAPNLNAIEAAARVGQLSSSNEATIVNPPRRAKTAYPISTFTYALVPTNAKQGRVLKQFLTYALTSGQQFGPRLDFAPLPSRVKNAALATVNRLPDS
jgi:phosphate transport system substrate-binding protein